MTFLTTILDSIIRFKLYLESLYHEYTKDEPGFYWLGFTIYRVDENGDHHTHHGNDLLRRTHQIHNKNYTPGPYSYCEELPLQAREINALLQEEDEEYLISVAYTYNDEEYRVVYRNRIDEFPPYLEKTIEDSRKQKMRRKITQAIVHGFRLEDDNEQVETFWDATDQILKYAGPLMNFYEDLHFEHNVVPVSLKTSTLHQTLLQRDEEYRGITIKDNRGKQISLRFDENFHLPPLMRTRVVKHESQSPKLARKKSD